jgi:hypothetical protein
MTTQKFKTDLQVVKFLIKQSGSSTWQLEKLTGISRQTFDRWKKADSLEVRGTTMQDFAGKLGYKVERNYNGIAVSPYNKEENGELTMNQQNMLIEYQQKEIADLKERVANHRATPIQETVWNQLDFDFEAQVKLTFENFTMGRTILSVTNIEIQSKILGYSLFELENIYDINAHHKSSQKHPVDALLNTKTLKHIKHQIKSLPSLFESLKNMMGNHYIPQTLTYIRKDKSLINAIAYNKVDWREKTVNSKIKFLLNE